MLAHVQCEDESTGQCMKLPLPALGTAPSSRPTGVPQDDAQMPEEEFTGFHDTRPGTPTSTIGSFQSVRERAPEPQLAFPYPFDDIVLRLPSSKLPDEPPLNDVEDLRDEWQALAPAVDACILRFTSKAAGRENRLQLGEYMDPSVRIQCQAAFGNSEHPPTDMSMDILLSALIGRHIVDKLVSRPANVSAAHYTRFLCDALEMEGRQYLQQVADDA